MPLSLLVELQKAPRPRPKAVYSQVLCTLGDLAYQSSWVQTASASVIEAPVIKGPVKRRRLQPGDRIWIREKPVRDYWTIFTQSMGVIGQVATVVLLFVSITK